MKDRFALLIIALLLLLTTLPYLLAVWWSSPDKVFLWSFYNSQDTSVYLSAMRAGARGEWLRALPFTSEPHDPALYYPLYLLLGRIAPNFITFHVARLAACVALGVALWQLTAEILSSLVERRIAVVLALLGMGVGWVVMLSPLRAWTRPTDIYAPTSSLLGAALLNPHFPLGAALQCAIFTLYVRAQGAPYPRGTLFWGALLSLALGLVLPYQVFNLVVLLGADVLLVNVWTWQRERRLRSFVWTSASRAALFLTLPSAIIVGYYVMLQCCAPFWSELIRQWPVLENQFDALDFIVGYGWQLVGALIALVWLWRQPQHNAGERFVIVWFVVNIILILSPLDFSDRTSLGFSAPLALLAAIALARVIPTWAWVRRLKQNFPSRLTLNALPIMVLSLTLPSVLLLMMFLPLGALNTGDLPFYLSRADRVVIQWLATHATPRDIVLASPSISNLIPALTDARVYAGHTHETYQANRKKAEIIQFFDAMSDAQRREFLQRHSITFVYAHPNAYSMGAFDGKGVSYLEPLLRQGDIILYRVSHTP
jgi:hypothetical protein